MQNISYFQNYIKEHYKEINTLSEDIFRLGYFLTTKYPNYFVKYNKYSHLEKYNLQVFSDYTCVKLIFEAQATDVFSVKKTTTFNEIDIYNTKDELKKDNTKDELKNTNINENIIAEYKCIIHEGLYFKYKDIKEIFKILREKHESFIEIENIEKKNNIQLFYMLHEIKNEAKFSLYFNIPLYDNLFKVVGLNNIIVFDEELSKLNLKYI